MVSDKISSSDIQNLANGILEVTLPDYKACRTALSLTTYVKDVWESENGPKPNFTSTINKETNTIKIVCVK